MREAEQAVLSCCLSDSDAIIRVIDILTPVMFVDENNARLFSAMLMLIKSNRPIDPMLISETEPDLIGYMGQLIASHYSGRNIEHYARKVIDMYRDRALACAGREIITIADQGTGDKLSLAMQRLIAVGDGIDHVGYQDSNSAMRKTLDYIEERHTKNGGLIGIPTGYTELDQTLSGLRPGCLYIIAGRPGMGKTTIAMNWACTAALGGQVVLVHSLEMPLQELSLRNISNVGSIPMDAVQHANFNEDQWPAFTASAMKLKESRMLIDDTPALTMTALSARAKRAAIVHGQIGMVVVDAIGLMREDGYQSRVEMIGAISRGLKALAKELKCPVIALSQLNRKCEERSDKRPELSDLRDSGDIEQDADVVIMCYRDAQYNPESNFARGRVAEILVKKNRHGVCKDIRMVDDLHISRFTNAHFSIYDIKKDNKQRGFE